MHFAVIQFPGSNCDQDCLRSLRDDLGIPADYVWHKDTSLGDGCDAVVLPGGFSYGDYLRCGAMAKFSPIMRAVRDFAAGGGLVIGVCNGFQMLCEMGLLPGALIRNRDLHFICEAVALRVETSGSPFTSRCRTGELLQIPIAHGEGSYFADDATLRDLEKHRQVLLRYVDPATGVPTPASNPNGSLAAIAGICNRERNVFGLMPHPDRASHPRLGSDDGRKIFESMADAIRGRRYQRAGAAIGVCHTEAPARDALVAMRSGGGDVFGV
ncbi:MAG: phosphoribosylformylglycinamidine synthase subunit PurQ [Verrucomicrobia bacterium]|nr:phosphoribosylformylglycinamidine synthase subunit PurQ [Verrucomicrobiota bacterium]MBV9658801.1 phosphoribosylformylglycinamidine synthase subunit PurQ [Verrucomicrobiota bacterium]